MKQLATACHEALNAVLVGPAAFDLAAVDDISMPYAGRDLRDEECAFLRAATCPDCEGRMIRQGGCCYCPDCGLESCRG